MRVITETQAADYIKHLALWRDDIMSKKQACKEDAKAHQEWLHQYLNICVLIKQTKKEIK